MSIATTKNKMHLLEFHFLSGTQTFIWTTGHQLNRLEESELLGEEGRAVRNSGYSFMVWKGFHGQDKEKLPSLVRGRDSLNTC